MRGDAPSASATDPVEQALLQARNLIDTAVSEFRSLSVTRFAELTTSRQGPWSETVVELIGGSWRTLTVTLSGESAQLAALCEILGRRRAVGGEPVTVRVLGSVAALEQLPPHLAEHCELRVSSVELAESLVVDSSAAVLREEGTHSGVLLVRDAAVVRTLGTMLAGAWSAALPWSEYRDLDDYLVTDVVRRVLGQLCHGPPDALAAQELGMSLRTYRRHVARIAQSLGVTSRFAAGARAAELQLLHRGEAGEA